MVLVAVPLWFEPPPACSPFLVDLSLQRRNRLRAISWTWKVRRLGSVVQARHASMPKRCLWSRKPSSAHV